MLVSPTLIPTHTSALDVLLVEDNGADARLVSEYLREAARPVTLTHAHRLGQAVDHLRRQAFDAVLLDLTLPDSDGFDTFSRTHEAAPDAPIVVLTGLDDEALAVRAVREGAQDYLVKGRVDAVLLYHSIRYAIERKRAERDIQDREERFRQLAENIQEVFFILDASYRETLYISPAYEQIWGRSCQSAYEDPLSFLQGVGESDRERVQAHIGAVQQGETPGEIEFRVVRPDGSVSWVLAHATPIRDAHGRIYRIAGVALDITRRKRAEEAVRASERRLRTLFETVNLIVLGLDVRGRVEYVNPFFLTLTGYAANEVLGRPWIDRFLPASWRDQIQTTFDELVAGAAHTHFRNPVLRKDGVERMISWHNTLVRDAEGIVTGTLSVGEDVTEHELLEEQFRQAQKMEAVGRLAGGVAHDFNNLLTVISGHSELLLAVLETEDANRTDVQAISQAAESASILTRQLLAFSRQQVLAPTILDLNEIVRLDEKMLRRLIGEDVRLVIVLARDLYPVKADSGQMEQVIMNLAVNARDAMPDGGTLTIETANVDLSDEYAREHLGGRSGPHVLLAISDSGLGMDAETQARIFEPFFTTKESGKGTGLGLATVYGIVKQSGGSIWVYSEPGQGSTFKIYLPRAAGSPATAATRVSTGVPRGTETVLLVEDAAGVRAIARKALERRGYAVIEAPDPAVAIALATRHPGTIHLLLTDVVMPDMNGRELAERIKSIRAGIRVLYMSGYTDDTIMRAGVLEHGSLYIEKPFSLDDLARKVRTVLDTTPSGTPEP